MWECDAILDIWLSFVPIDAKRNRVAKINPKRMIWMLSASTFLG